MSDQEVKALRHELTALKRRIENDQKRASNQGHAIKNINRKLSDVEATQKRMISDLTTDHGAELDASGNAAGVDLIIAERHRQIVTKGYTTEQDDVYTAEQLPNAAMAYLACDRAYWPTGWKWPSDGAFAKTATGVGRIKQLSKAGALIAAEIDRLLRQPS